MNFFFFCHQQQSFESNSCDNVEQITEAPITVDDTAENRIIPSLTSSNGANTLAHTVVGDGRMDLNGTGEQAKHTSSNDQDLAKIVKSMQLAEYREVSTLETTSNDTVTHDKFALRDIY